MTRLAVLFAVCAALAGCGADGEPIHPTFAGSVSVGSSGVYTSGGVGLSSGPISIFVGSSSY